MKTSLVNSAAFVAILVATACSADEPMSGTYQIQSGTYRVMGGAVGTLSYILPNQSQAYVSLWIGSGTGPAALTFLDASLHTSLPPLTNGTVSGNTIVFQYVTRGPLSSQEVAWVDYTVTSSAGHLWISGSITSAPACCDIPYL